MLPMSNLRWQILVAADNEDRREEVRKRRQARALLRGFNVIQMISDHEFVKSFRLNKIQVQQLLEDVSRIIPSEQRKDGISVMMKLLISLSFYGTGSYQSLIARSAFHNVSQTTVSRAVRQVTEALNDPAIYHKYVKFPIEQQDRNDIKAKFYQKFKIPGVLGCIDGTHVAILRPHIHEERYFNRKGYHSLNVMIVCDSDLNITCVDASIPGAAHDSNVWQSNPLSQYLMGLAGAGGDGSFLLGDSGYPLRKWMMTPILNTTEGTPEHYYYNLHVTARNTVERCIGVLKARFRCLLAARALHYAPNTAGQIVNACCVLHNITNRARLPIPSLLPEEVEAENLRQYQVQEDLRAEAESLVSRSGRVNPDLLEGRAMQQALLNKLWAER